MNNVVLTFDIDWAPEFAIDFVIDRLLERRVRATFFITHKSPALERLRQYPELFELGIHPNFLPGSTHGETPSSVLRHCMALVPETISMRSHALVQSSFLLNRVLTETPITTDVSLFLQHAVGLHPVEYRWNGHALWRLPYFWEDDFEMEREHPCWHLPELLGAGHGLKIFDFHPIHVYLNSADVKPYQALKQTATVLGQLKPDVAAGYVNQEAGTRTMFLEVVDYLSAQGNSARIMDISPEPALSHNLPPRPGSEPE
jgi:hypothetical protein